MIGYERFDRDEQLFDSPEGHYQKRRWRRERERFSLRVEDIFSRDRLYQTFLATKRQAGRAPGPDGITFDELSPTEIGSIAEAYAQAIAAGSYRPYPARRVRIPKPGKRTFRELKIRSLFDRVIARCLCDTFSPMAEKMFLLRSYGFRQGLGILNLLAELAVTMPRRNRWTLAVDDVRQAFDNVHRELAMEAHVKFLQTTNYFTTLSDSQQKRLLSTVRVILFPDHPSIPKRGIDQGSPYSPLALNILLHYAFDTEINQPLTLNDKPQQIPSWHRYADNLVFACQDVSEGHAMLERSQGLMKAAQLALKGLDGVHDLSTDNRVELLGFILGKHNSELSLQIPEKAWEELTEHLVKAHTMNDPHSTAISGLKSWISSYGPTFENGEPPKERLLSLLAQHGFREGNLIELIRRHAQSAWLHWRSMCSFKGSIS